MKSGDMLWILSFFTLLLSLILLLLLLWAPCPGKERKKVSIMLPYESCKSQWTRTAGQGSQVLLLLLRGRQGTKKSQNKQLGTWGKQEGVVCVRRSKSVRRRKMRLKGRKVSILELLHGTFTAGDILCEALSLTLVLFFSWTRSIEPYLRS